MGKYINDDDLVSVRNRNNGTTFYDLPEKHISRTFVQDQVKQIAFSELADLMYTGGGEYLIRHLLVIEDENARKELGLEVEPEYLYTRDDIRNLLFTGTLDQLEDFLNFAPEGAIQIARDIAIDEALPDVRKRDMISKKTGFEINKAIELKAMMSDETEEEQKKERKAEVPIRKSTDAPKRKYNVTVMGG